MKEGEQFGGGVRPDRSDRAVYIISVAAELAGVHPQTLRIYERKGLLRPKRTSGNTRRYSDRDIERLQMIQELTQRQGINLAGVKQIMEMEIELDRLRELADRLEHELRKARRAATERPDDSGARAQIIPLRSVFVFPWQEEEG